MIDFKNNKAWQNLTSHAQQMTNTSMRDLFAQNRNRFGEFSVEAAGLFLDYSKNRITAETMHRLISLVEECNLAQKIQAMFSGEEINVTEHRAVMHIALRNQSDQPIFVGGKDIMPMVRESLTRTLKFAEEIRALKICGYSGKPITDVVNIGIGGSDLGPAMVTAALMPYKSTAVNCHFVSNVDSTHICETLKNLDPETTLFTVASKTFTTQETLCNANTAKDWLLKKALNKEATKKHFAAITASPENAKKFGITDDRIYPFWDFVGGRYSLWSAIGLPIAISIGSDNFKALLKGAHLLDQHFFTAPWQNNLPVILALLGIWNIDFLNAKTLAILPYDQYLQLLPSYLQQLDMESNGKNVRIDGSAITVATAPVIWGMPGTNGQHAFHQLLMQGTQLIPVDFILPLATHNKVSNHHQLLVANCLAQSQALCFGKNLAEITAELKVQGLSESEIKQLAPHKVIPGNVPSNTITFPKLTPETMGALIALYEHKVFVQGAIWGINSFDQWGVELGKKLTQKIVPVVEGKKVDDNFDSSTQGLIAKFLREPS